MKHVEMYDGRTFCGESIGADRVWQQDWHAAAEAVQASDCPDCLMRLFMLGDSAAYALQRMGLKVEVRDVPLDAEVS